MAGAAVGAYGGEALDMSKDEGLAEICRRAGVDVDDLFAGIARPEVKDQLRANTEEVVARGGFGSPTIFVGGTDMYFGNDRLPLVRSAVLRARTEG